MHFKLFCGLLWHYLQSFQHTELFSLLLRGGGGGGWKGAFPGVLFNYIQVVCVLIYNAYS